jgi:hypothetical protein
MLSRLHCVCVCVCVCVCICMCTSACPCVLNDEFNICDRPVSYRQEFVVIFVLYISQFQLTLFSDSAEIS